MPSVTESVQDYMRALFLRFILFYSILPNNPHPSLGLAAVTKCMILFFCRCASGPGERGETEVQTEVGRREQRLPRAHHPPSCQEAM